MKELQIANLHKSKHFNSEYNLIYINQTLKRPLIISKGQMIYYRKPAIKQLWRTNYLKIPNFDYNHLIYTSSFKKMIYNKQSEVHVVIIENVKPIYK